MFVLNGLTLGLFMFGATMSGLTRDFSCFDCSVSLFNRVIIFDILCEGMVAKFVVSVSTNNLNLILLAEMIDLL